MLGGLGGPELLVVLAIVLLLFGGNKLPEVAQSMGQAMRSFKSEANKMQSEVDVEADTSEQTQTSEAEETDRQGTSAQQTSERGAS